MFVLAEVKPACYDRKYIRSTFRSQTPKMKKPDSIKTDAHNGGRRDNKARFSVPTFQASVSKDCLQSKLHLVKRSWLWAYTSSVLHNVNLCRTSDQSTTLTDFTRVAHCVTMEIMHSAYVDRCVEESPPYTKFLSILIYFNDEYCDFLWDMTIA